MEAFLATASIEGKPRNWMLDQHRRKQWLARHGVSLDNRPPEQFAYNVRWPGVCLIVSRVANPFVLTVQTRDRAREAKRRRLQTVEAAERYHRREAKQFRRINKAT
jgi:hypothetical protein